MKTAKDKADELNPSIDQTKTTHHSEALDTLITALLAMYGEKKEFEDV